jgi:hypothetical protein
MKHKFLFYLFTPVVEEHKADMLVLAWFDYVFDCWELLSYIMYHLVFELRGFWRRVTLSPFLHMLHKSMKQLTHASEFRFGFARLL